MREIDWSFITVDKTHFIPVYEQIIGCIAEAIQNNVITKGVKLKSPTEMAKLLNVSLYDINKSFGDFIINGVIKIDNNSIIQDIDTSKLQNTNDFHKNFSRKPNRSNLNDNESKFPSLLNTLSDIINEFINIGVTRDDIIKTVRCACDKYKCGSTNNIPSDINPDSVFTYGYERIPVWFEDKLREIPKKFCTDEAYVKDIKNAGLNNIVYYIKTDNSKCIGLAKGNIICKDKYGYIRIYIDNTFNSAFIGIKCPKRERMYI